eukprot:5416935-Pyramimonas_sp.AAC.1
MRRPRSREVPHQLRAAWALQGQPPHCAAMRLQIGELLSKRMHPASVVCEKSVSDVEWPRQCSLRAVRSAHAEPT